MSDSGSGNWNALDGAPAFLRRRVNPPVCNALSCRSAATRIVLQEHPDGGIFAGRVCANCLQRHLGIGYGYTRMTVLRVKRWKKPPRKGYGWVSDPKGDKA